jgi:hypothetical protein
MPDVLTEMQAQAPGFSHGVERAAMLVSAAGLAVSARGGQAAVRVPVKREPSIRLAAFRDQPLPENQGPTESRNGSVAGTRMSGLPSVSEPHG